MSSSVLERVDPQTRRILERYDFDEQQFTALQASVASGDLSPARNAQQGTIAPPPGDAIVRLPAPSDHDYAQLHAAGREALAQGHVAMAVLNGGMATRFGGGVKGIVEAVEGRSFLEWKLLETARVEHELGGAIPFLVMNSFATDAPTRDFLARLAASGRSSELPQPLLFSQSVSLRLTADGSLFRTDDGRASPYAPGHGDFNPALLRSGLLPRLRERGVRMLMLSNVDNLGARPDPLVIGAHLCGGRPMTTEVAAKDPHDAGGAPALVDGRLMVLEGFRFPPGFDQDRIDVFSVNSFVFSLEILEQAYPLSWFYVQKQVQGHAAVQLERLINELTAFVPSTFLRVPRQGPRGRFFPIKTHEDLVAAQEPLREMLEASVLEHT